jgi:hypothetical protein
MDRQVALHPHRTMAEAKVNRVTWTARRLERLRHRDGDYCSICGVLMRFDKWTAETAIDVTMDHIKPIAEGGPLDSMANMKLAHRWCNSRRGILPWSHDLAMICRETILKQRKKGLEWLSHQKDRQVIREFGIGVRRMGAGQPRGEEQADARTGCEA